MNLLTENAVYTHVYQIWNNGCLGAATKLQVLQISQDEDDCRRKMMTKYFLHNHEHFYQEIMFNKERLDAFLKQEWI